MSYTYAGRRPRSKVPEQKDVSGAQPTMDALRSGAASPTREQMGRRVDLPDAIRSKMENAFGADFSSVKLHESQAVAEAGAGAMTRGSDIAFAPGMLDFTSYGGQALLGHELSHVVSQARGEVSGSGFLNDHALEARADREGAMAAAGQQISMPASALSPASAAPAAGPMQAGDKIPSKKQPEPEPEFDTDADPGELADAAPSTAKPAEPAVAGPSKDFNFTPETQQSPLSHAGVGFLLGSENADDEKHGAEYSAMMASLKTLSSVKRKHNDMGGQANDAMQGNAIQGVIESMEAYRDKLGSEWFRRSERKRQMAIMDQLISQARADQSETLARQNTTLGGREYSGIQLGGGVNDVYRYQRGRQGAFFKKSVVSPKIMRGTSWCSPA